MERYNFETNQMLICGIGDVPKDCGDQGRENVLLAAPGHGLSRKREDGFP